MGLAYSPFVIPIVAIVGWFTYSIVRAITSARVRELEVRERIAMIERGLVPPPEKDPGGFDRAMDRYERVRERGDYGRTPGRYRSVGVTLMGVGFGLMLMIGVAGESPDAGVGVGGFLVLIGIAFVVNGWMSNRYAPRNPVDRPGGPSA